MVQYLFQNQKETIEDRIKEVKDLEETHNLFEYYLNSWVEMVYHMS